MILLDTHTWIWLLAAPEQLSRRALSVIEMQSGPETIVVSAISVWELFMLVKKGRIKLEAGASAFVSATHRDSRFRIEPVDEIVSRRSVELPDLHPDPVDRIILATAGELGCPLISKDSRLRDYDLVSVIW